MLAFTNVGQPGKREFRGTLSPNMRWYAAPQGESWCSSTSCQIVASQIEKLHVFDLTSPDPRAPHYTLDWPLFYYSDRTYWDAPQILWVNNQELIYARQLQDPASKKIIALANPFTSETTEWSGIVDKYSFPWFISPDLSRAFERFFISSSVMYAYSYLYDVSTGEGIHVYDPEIFRFTRSWSPDSSYFIGRVISAENVEKLRLYNRSGEKVETIMTTNWNDFPNIDRNYEILDWSPDGRYLAVGWGKTFERGDSHFSIYIVDLQEKHLLDTCLSEHEATNFRWSPDSEWIAFPYNWVAEDRRITVINRQARHWYTVAYADNVNILGWRAD